MPATRSASSSPDWRAARLLKVMPVRSRAWRDVVAVSRAALTEVSSGDAASAVTLPEEPRAAVIS